jgi:hypothetical protein
MLFDLGSHGRADFDDTPPFPIEKVEELAKTEPIAAGQPPSRLDQSPHRIWWILNQLHDELEAMVMRLVHAREVGSAVVLQAEEGENREIRGPRIVHPIAHVEDADALGGK